MAGTLIIGIIIWALGLVIPSVWIYRVVEKNNKNVWLSLIYPFGYYIITLIVEGYAKVI